jgi:hypothetical protein
MFDCISDHFHSYPKYCNKFVDRVALDMLGGVFLAEDMQYYKFQCFRGTHYLTLQGIKITLLILKMEAALSS